MKKVSKLLSDYQTIHHLTYEKAAENLKLSKSSFYAYIKEKRNPTMNSLIKIAKSLNVNISSLIDGSYFDEKEMKFLKLLREEPTIYKLLLEYPEEEIEKLKKSLITK